MTNAIVIALLVVWPSVAAAAPPGPPQGLTSTVNGRIVNLSWLSPSTGGIPTGYRVEVAVAPRGIALASLAVNGLAISVSDAPIGVYYVRVRATNSDGESEASSEIVVIVMGGTGGACNSAPNSPQNVVSTIIGNLITIQWSPWSPSTGGCHPTGYLVQVGSSPGLSNVAIVNLGAVTQISGSAQPGTYVARVLAVNAFGASAPSNEITLTVGGPPVISTTIGGTVRSTTGVVIPNATILVVNPITDSGLQTTTDPNGLFRLSGIRSTTFVVRYSANGYDQLERTYTFMLGTTRTNLDTRLTLSPRPVVPWSQLPPISDAAKAFIINGNLNRYGNGQGLVRWNRFPIRVYAPGFRSQDVADATNIWMNATGGRVTFSIVANATNADIVFDLTGEGVPPGACGVEGPSQIIDFEIRAGFGHYLNEPRCAPSGEWKIGLAHGIGHIIGMGGHTPSGSDLMGSPLSIWSMSSVMSEFMTWLYSVPVGTRPQ